MDFLLLRSSSSERGRTGGDQAHQDLRKVTEKNDETMERLPAVFSKGDLKAIAETMGVTMAALRLRLRRRINDGKLVLEGEIFRKTSIK